MKKIATALILIAFSNISLYSMKRRLESDSVQQAQKREHIDPNVSDFPNKNWRAVCFMCFEQKMELSFSVNPEQIDSLRNNFINHSITGDNKLGLLLGQYYLACMNNLRANQKKIGGPDMYIIDGQIVFQ